MPESFAARPPYPSCGEDSSLELDPVGPPSTLRLCFLDANEAAKPGELTSHEASTSSDAASSYVYRTNRDRSVDVFVSSDGRRAGRPWQAFHCAGLAPDKRQVFQLVGCGDPVDID
ncbi:MAG: hypothetical protein H0U21_04130 [Acidimicrobiia bacterium]|nr:hypothetical protein [Acidimicrobiia bacterium]